MCILEAAPAIRRDLTALPAGLSTVSLRTAFGWWWGGGGSKTTATSYMWGAGVGG